MIEKNRMYLGTARGWTIRVSTENTGIYVRKNLVLAGLDYHRKISYHRYNNAVKRWTDFQDGWQRVFVRGREGAILLHEVKVRLCA